MSIEFAESSIIHQPEQIYSPSGINEEEIYDEKRDQLFSYLLEMNFEERHIRQSIRNGAADPERATDLIFRMIENEQRISSGISKCSICQEILKLENIITLPDCSDYFCKGCLFEYLKVRIEDGEVLTMPCPNHECNSEISESMIKSIVTKVLYEKFTIFKNNEELSKNPFLR